MRPVFIYALLDPITEEVRYIGKSINPVARLKDHLKTAKREKCHRASWILSLKAQNLRPRLEILDEVPEVEWQQWEVAYIEFFREAGCDLVNQTFGGESPPILRAERHPNFGKKFSCEYRAKLSAAHIGIMVGERHPNFGKKFSLERCQKMRLAAGVGKDSPLWGKKRPSSVGAKISATKKRQAALKKGGF